MKRTTALDCVRLYEGKLGTAERVIFTPNGQRHDIGVMGLTLAKPVESAWRPSRRPLNQGWGWSAEQLAVMTPLGRRLLGVEPWA